MADFTMQMLGDYIVTNPDALPPGFVSGRTGQYTPEARAVVQASLVAAAEAERANAAKQRFGMELPAVKPGVYNELVPERHPYWGAAPAGCCPDELSLRDVFEVTSENLDLASPLERYLTGDNMPGVAPDVSIQDVSIGGGPVNAAVMRTPSIPLTSVVESPTDVMTMLRQQAFGASRPMRRYRDRAALEPQPVGVKLAGLLGDFVGGLGAFDQTLFDTAIDTAMGQISRNKLDAAQTQVNIAAAQLDMQHGSGDDAASFAANTARLNTARNLLKANRDYSYQPVAVNPYAVGAALKSFGLQTGGQTSATKWEAPSEGLLERAGRWVDENKKGLAVGAAVLGVGALAVRFLRGR